MRDIAKLTGSLAERRESLRNVIHNFRIVAEELGSSDAQLAQFVDSSNAVMESFANQSAAIQDSLS